MVAFRTLDGVPLRLSHARRRFTVAERNESFALWQIYRKKTTIRAILITGPEVRCPNIVHTQLANPDRSVGGDGRGFRVQTLEGLTDWLPYPYYVATDGVSYWPVSPDYMEANYEPV